MPTCIGVILCGVRRTGAFLGTDRRLIGQTATYMSTFVWHTQCAAAMLRFSSFNGNVVCYAVGCREAVVAAALAARRTLLVSMAKGLLSAISYCHQRGVAHCGIGAGGCG